MGLEQWEGGVTGNKKWKKRYLVRLNNGKRRVPYPGKVREYSLMVPDGP